MSRTQRFLTGFVTGYAHMILATIAGLWLTPFFLRHLGQSTYGLWLVGTQIIAYLLLMDLGIVALLPRETAYVTGRTGRHDAPELRQLIEKALTLACVQTPVVLAAAVFALWWLPESWAALRVAAGRRPRPVRGDVSAARVPGRADRPAGSRLRRAGAVRRLGRRARWSTSVLVLQGFTLSALAAGWCVTQAVVIGACAVRLAWVFPGRHAAPPRLVASSGRRASTSTRSIWVSVSQIAQVLLNGTDVMIVGALLGPAAVVPYACTGKLVSVLANQPQAILQSAAPALSELRTTSDRGRLFQVSSALAQATLAVSGLVACVVLAVNAGFVRWWVGPEQFGGLGADAAPARGDDHPPLQHHERLRAVLFRPRAAAGADRPRRWRHDARASARSWSARSASPARRSERLRASSSSALRSISRSCRGKPV